MSTAPQCDLLSGQLSPVSKVVETRTGKRPTPAAIWRWCRKGLRGGTIKLEAIHNSGTWMTTPAAYDDFLRRQTEAALAESGDAPEIPDVSDDDLRAEGLL